MHINDNVWPLIKNKISNNPIANDYSKVLLFVCYPELRMIINYASRLITASRPKLYLSLNNTELYIHTIHI